MGKVIVEGFINVPEKDLELVIKELANHVALTRRETGCIIFEVKQDKGNKTRFNVYEEFINQEAFDSHQERVKQSLWGEVTKGFKRNYTIRS